MTNAFTRKLSRFAELSDEEIAALEVISAQPQQRTRGENLIQQGERPDRVQLMLSGWGFRYKVLGNGKRQIVGYLLPGDICDLHVCLLGEMDHSIGLLTDAEVVAIPAGRLQALMDRYRSVELALWRATLVDEAVLREWLTNIGQREAFSRIGHHLCELWHRMANVGLVDQLQQFDLPVTQEELGDSLGLSHVHINRTIKRLREEQLITFEHKRLTILDPQRLLAITGFDADYLHLGQNQKAEVRVRSWAPPKTPSPIGA